MESVRKPIDFGTKRFIQCRITPPVAQIRAKLRKISILSVLQCS
jgi:hypothetical protein